VARNDICRICHESYSICTDSYRVRKDMSSRMPWQPFFMRRGGFAAI